MVDTTAGTFTPRVNRRLAFVGVISGVFITYASDVAAMAPGTHTGAASPLLAIGGYPVSVDETMEKKILNDATAYLRSYAGRRLWRRHHGNRWCAADRLRLPHRDDRVRARHCLRLWRLLRHWTCAVAKRAAERSFKS